jgi:hypothetical protein
MKIIFHFETVCWFSITLVSSDLASMLSLHLKLSSLSEIGNLHFEIVKHAGYTPDLDLSDYEYCVIPNLKKVLKRKKFPSIQEATLPADGWFAAQPEEFFLNWLNKLEQRSHKYVWSSW